MTPFIAHVLSAVALDLCVVRHDGPGSRAMRPHRLTATAETRSIDARASDAVAGAGSLHVWLLIGTGVVAAAQIGKAIISVPMIRSDLMLGLDLAGLVVATFATLGATVGIGAGVVVGRLGARRSLIGGMVAIGLGNAIGAGAPDALVLLEARIIEGAGFLGVVLAIPSILARVVRRGARDFVMGAWSAYMPTGIMLMLFTSAHGMPLGAAGLLSALVLAVSAVGHLASGFLLRAGVPIWTNIGAAFGFFILSGFAVYGGVLPAQGVTLTAALALGIGGLAPGAIYGAAPHAAPAPAAVPPTIGLVQQASNLGQFAGPLVLGLWVEHLGWQAAPAILAPAALAGLASALVLRRILNTAQ
jgi:predicted MFS family arabinose efflux permease